MGPDPAVAEFLKKNASEATLLESGKIKCTLTGHEMPAKIETLESYWRGKQINRARKQLETNSNIGIDKNLDLTPYQPWIKPNVKHPETKVFCELTRKTLNKSQHEINLHISGKRYKNSLRDYQRTMARRKNQVKDADEGQYSEEEEEEDDDDDANEMLEFLGGQKRADVEGDEEERNGVVKSRMDDVANDVKDMELHEGCNSEENSRNRKADKASEKGKKKKKEKGKDEKKEKKGKEHEGGQDDKESRETKKKTHKMGKVSGEENPHNEDHEVGTTDQKDAGSKRDREFKKEKKKELRPSKPKRQKV